MEHKVITELYKIAYKGTWSVDKQEEVSGLISEWTNQIRCRDLGVIHLVGRKRFEVETTPRKYQIIRQYLETYYPGLCEFEV